MSDIAPLGRPDPAPIAKSYASRAYQSHAAPPAANEGVKSDRIEFSDVARLRSKLSSLPDVREDLVNRVRGEIEAGNYESDEKVNVAVGRLLDELA